MSKSSVMVLAGNGMLTGTGEMILVRMIQRRDRTIKKLKKANRFLDERLNDLVIDRIVKREKRKTKAR